MNSFKKQSLLHWKKPIVALIMIAMLTSCGRLRTIKLVNWDRTAGIEQRKNVTDKKTAKLKSKLQGQGVQVVTLGQDYKLNFPAEMLFDYRTPKIRWGSYPLLNDITAYISQYRIVNLYVYTSAEEGSSNKRNFSLANQRAREVADYIGARTKEARIIVAQGDPHPVVPPGKGLVNGYHESQVTISFRNKIV